MKPPAFLRTGGYIFEILLFAFFFVTGYSPHVYKYYNGEKHKMVQIFGDSTSDLPQALVKGNNITIIPLYVTMGNFTGRDGLEVTPSDIFEWTAYSEEIPKTAAFSPEDAAKALMKAREAGDDVVFIGISEQMSSSCNSVRLGAQAIDYEDHVYVVDSKNLCSGIGMLLLYAAELAEAGESAAVIAEKSRALAERVRSSFIIDTLDFLAKGGRCSSATAVVGNALKIKPRIIVKDGAMSVDKKYRGDQKVVAKHYVKDLKKELLAADPRCVFLVRAGLPEEIFEEAVKTVTDLKHFEHILTAEAGAIISSHCGPGTLGVFYVEKA